MDAIESLEAQVKEVSQQAHEVAFEIDRLRQRGIVRPIDIGCPQCKVPKGKPCRTHTGREAYPHRLRQDEAQRFPHPDAEIIEGLSVRHAEIQRTYDALVQDLTQLRAERDKQKLNEEQTKRLDALKARITKTSAITVVADSDGVLVVEAVNLLRVVGMRLSWEETEELQSFGVVVKEISRPSARDARGFLPGAPWFWWGF